MFIIIVFVFPYIHPDTQAQNVVSTIFTPDDKFSTPVFNGSISFVANGSCSSVTLVNDTWTFMNLSLNNSEPLGNLTVSAINSNMTIFSYRSFNLFGRSAQLRYNVQGVGTQTINLGLNSSESTSASEWGITLPGSVFPAEGEGWTLLPDNSVVIKGLTGNVSVTHYNFSITSDSNLPFYYQHSISIITATVFIIILAIAIVIKFNVRS
jgi:hypothetical protein